MAKKKKISKKIKTLKTALKEDRIIIGANKVTKALKKKELDKVYLADNCGETLEENIEYLCDLYNIDLIKLSYPNEELGTLIKKPFPISILGVK